VAGLTGRGDRLAQLTVRVMSHRRRGVALALVLLALLLAGVLAAGGVMAAGQAMRDSAGSIVRARAMAGAEQGLALTVARWNAAWNASGPAGLVALIPADSADLADTVRVIRLHPGAFLLISESLALAPSTLSARSRVSLLVTLDSMGHPTPAHHHSWAELP
jgi:hypothetical protein